MKLTDEQRAACVEAVSQALLAAAVDGVPAWARAAGADDQDFLSIGITAAISVAVSFAATRCVDAPAAVALVRTLAEGVAQDIYRAVE